MSAPTITRAITPEKMLQAVMKEKDLKTISALSRALGVVPSTLARVRSGANKLSPSIVLKVHILTGWPIDEIQKLAGKPVEVGAEK